jgi:hypothetical protein
MSPASGAATQPSEPSHVPAPNPPPWQQACPDAPQAAHVPPAQLAPCAVQKVSANPPSGAAPQHCWPTAPHGLPELSEQLPLAHVPDTPLPVQASPDPTHMRAPAIPGRQHPPPLQLFPPQHGCPEAPQAALPPPAPPAAWPPLPPPEVPPLPPPLLGLLLQASPRSPTITMTIAYLTMFAPRG